MKSCLTDTSYYRSSSNFSLEVEEVVKIPSEKIRVATEAKMFKDGRIHPGIITHKIQYFQID